MARPPQQSSHFRQRSRGCRWLERRKSYLRASALPLPSNYIECSACASESSTGAKSVATGSSGAGSWAPVATVSSGDLLEVEGRR